MNEPKQAQRRFQGRAERLRAPERLARLQVTDVVRLCLEGVTAHSALDVGTGAGVFAQAFAEQGLGVAGVDAEPEMVDAARTWVPQGRFGVALAEDLPYSDAAFDLVFLGHLLHEAERPLEALREARRVARLRVAVLEWAYREDTWGPPLAHRLPPQRIDELAKQAGLSGTQPIELRHMLLYRYDLPQRLGAPPDTLERRDHD